MWQQSKSVALSQCVGNKAEMPMAIQQTKDRQRIPDINKIKILILIKFLVR